MVIRGPFTVIYVLTSPTAMIDFINTNDHK